MSVQRRADIVSISNPAIGGVTTGLSREATPAVGGAAGG